VVTQGLKQTAAGRKNLLTVRLTLLAIFLGIPLVLTGVVVALMYWGKPLTHQAEIQWPQSGPADVLATPQTSGIHWPQSGVAGFLVVANACLYFMGSGLLLKPNRWKRFMLPVMLLVPILVAPAIPYSAAKPGLATIFEPLPPVILVLGIVWVLSGAIALILFMRRNPLPAAETP
jgi:hypothetical protein